MTVLSVYSTFASAQEAKRIAGMVVDERLAACANILAPCASLYRWKGKLERSEEVPALFKTTADKADALIARIAELHGYDTPAIVAWPIDRLHADYAEWVEDALR